MTFSSELVGDNIEFSAVGIGDYEIFFNTTETDTEFKKYPKSENRFTARRISLRPNQTINVLGLNGRTFTNPATVTLNTEYRERRDTAMLNRIKIRTTVANTSIKIRWN